MAGKYDVQVVGIFDNHCIIIDYKAGKLRHVNFSTTRQNNVVLYSGTEAFGGNSVPFSSGCTSEADVLKRMYGNVNVDMGESGFFKTRVFGIRPDECRGVKKSLFEAAVLYGGDLCVECRAYGVSDPRRFARIPRFPLDWMTCESDHSKVAFGYCWIPEREAWYFTVRLTNYTFQAVLFYKDSFLLTMDNEPHPLRTFREVSLG